MNTERRHIEAADGHWNPEDHVDRAEDMYRRMFEMKFLPGGRGLSAMGSKVIEERGVNAALNNCAFVSTADIGNDDYAITPFIFLMDMSMCGVGTGFDTRGAGKRKILGHNASNDNMLVHKIEDSREGWVDSLARLLRWHFFEDVPLPIFDYSLVRKEGEPIKGFGGVSGGPGPLIKMHLYIDRLLCGRRGEFLSIRDIVDIMNIIGKCVISGNVRRMAEIAFGEPVDEFLDLKNPEVNAYRKEFMWASNNSVQATLGMDYSGTAKRTQVNGEPGYIWLENIHRYGRVRAHADEGVRPDSLALGTNPCGEQPLENFELCCLVEVYPNRCADRADFLDTLHAAYQYAKVITLADVHWPQSVEVMKRNRRIGISLSGIAQFVARYSIEHLEEYCESGYRFVRAEDVAFSKYLGVNESIRLTTVKPSGSVSLLAGATPGLHYPIAPYYIRRMQISQISPIVDALREAGYTVEKSVYADATLVVEFPVYVGDDAILTEDQVSMIQQLELVKFMQEHWSDNAVSATVKFDPETEGGLLQLALETYQHHLKGISFLPNIKGVYDQMPYEPIDKATYEVRRAALKPIRWSDNHREPQQHIFCDTDHCGYTPVHQNPLQ